MKKVLIVILLLYPFTVMSELKDEAELDKLAEKVMEQIDNANYEKAVDLLRPHWGIPKHEIDGFAYKINQQLSSVSERLGENRGFILACTQSISSVGKRISYIQKFENHAIVWIFIFYKPKDEWSLNTFLFSDKWHELFGVGCSKK